MRCALTLAWPTSSAWRAAPSGSSFAEAVTAAHARWWPCAASTASRAASTRSPPMPTRPAPSPIRSPCPSWASKPPGRRRPWRCTAGSDLAADVFDRPREPPLLALLQNLDVIILGSKAHEHSGAYAAISVPAKALVFGALVLVNYLLPEATIRHQQGAHALRQLSLHPARAGDALRRPAGAVGRRPPRACSASCSGPSTPRASAAFSTLVLAMVLHVGHRGPDHLPPGRGVAMGRARARAWGRAPWPPPWPGPEADTGARPTATWPCRSAWPPPW